MKPFKLCSYILLGILLVPVNVYSQQRALDSLAKVLKTEKEDTNKVNTLNKLSDKFEAIGKKDTSLVCANIAELLAQKLGYKKGLADALINIGYFYFDACKYSQALDYFEKSLSINSEIGNKTGVAHNITIIGLVYYSQGNYPQTLKYFLKSLAISREIGNKESIALNFGNIGNVYYTQGDYLKALENVQKALAIDREIGNKSGIARDLGNIGIIYLNEGDYKKALENNFEALDIEKEFGDKQSIAIAFVNIGIAYQKLGNDSIALDYYNKALNINHEIGNQNGIAGIFSSMGDAYFAQGDYHKAMENDQEALVINREIGNKNGIAGNLRSIGHVYTIGKNYKLAEPYLDSALDISISLGNKDDIKEDYKCLALFDSATAQYKKGWEDYEKYINYRDSVASDEFSKKILQADMKYQFAREEDSAKVEQDKKDTIQNEKVKKQAIFIWSVCGGLLLILVFSGILFNRFRITQKQKKIIEQQKGKVELAYKNLEILNDVSSEITSTLDLDRVMKLIYDNISRLMDVSFFIISAFNEKEQSVRIKFCVKEGRVVEEDFKTSITNSNSFTALTIKSKKEIIILDLNEEYSKYLSGKPQLHGKEDTWQESIIMIPLLIQDNLIGLFSVQSPKKHAYSKSDIEILRSLSTVIAVALNNAESYNKLNTAHVEISKQKSLIEEKNKEVLDSITYAKRLQDAILPPLSTIKKYLPDSFLLYKPKDIVAGDFYWMERAGDSILIAACDCTGHGVPGAMVSVVCSNALNRTVKEFKITEPGKMLDKVREIVLETFEKSESDVQDGMDISLCHLNTQTKEIQWSGANNPLWYFQNGELKEIAPDKQPIGKFNLTKPFNTTSLKLQKGDTLYLFTDGYADQFGGPKGKKFKYQQLSEKLKVINGRPMEEQKQMLDETIESWRGSLEQVDDILIIGVRV